MLDFGLGFNGVFVLCALAAGIAFTIYGLVYLRHRVQL